MKFWQWKLYRTGSTLQTGLLLGSIYSHINAATVLEIINDYTHVTSSAIFINQRAIVPQLKQV